MDNNIKNWDDIYSANKAGCFMNYPNDNFVTLFFQNKKHINTSGKCLDYGFGSANNSEFLLQHMGELFGIEISKSCLEIANKRLSKFTNYHPDNFFIDGDNKCFNGCFDLVVAWQMLYYNDKAGLNSSIDKLFNYLKVNGILICTLITPKDVKVKHSTMVDKDTYLIDKRIPHQEGCMVFSPKTDKDFIKLFARFEIVDHGYYERASFLFENTTSEYYLVAKKHD